MRMIASKPVRYAGKKYAIGQEFEASGKHARLYEAIGHAYEADTPALPPNGAPMPEPVSPPVHIAVEPAAAAPVDVTESAPLAVAPVDSEEDDLLGGAPAAHVAEEKPKPTPRRRYTRRDLTAES